MFRTVVFLAAAVGVFTACGSSTSPASEAPPPATRDTSLGAGDTFEVRVYGEEELSGEYRVASDGTIDFPLIGRLEVEGKEAPQVARLIKARLKDEQILKRPYVSILVKEYASKRISVVGAVSKPGNFPMTSGLTVVQAISLAGGFTPLASKNDIIVTRHIDDELKRFKVPVEEVTEGRADDFPLQAGDIIYVPERMF